MFENEKIVNYGLVLALILVGIAFRFFPHLPNFSPIIAIALLGAAYLPRKLALFIPLLIMTATDLLIGSYQWNLMFIVYGSLLLIVGLGFYLRKNDDWGAIALISLSGSILFFIASNFGVWLLTPWYEKTITGLLKCYYLALPFFRNTMVSTLLYGSALFFSYKTIRGWLHRKVLSLIDQN